MSNATIETQPAVDIDYEFVGYIESLIDSSKTIQNGGSPSPTNGGQTQTPVIPPSMIIVMTGCQH